MTEECSYLKIAGFSQSHGHFLIATRVFDRISILELNFEIMQVTGVIVMT